MRSYLELTRNNFHLCDTMAVPQHYTDLRRCGTLSCKLADVIDDGFGGRFEPSGNGAGVRDCGGADAFAFAVKTTHLCDLVGEDRGMKMSLPIIAQVEVKSCAECRCRPLCGGSTQISWRLLKLSEIASCRPSKRLDLHTGFCC